MKETIDVQPIETQAIALRPASAVGQALTVNEILAQVKLIQDVMRSVMSEGEHYGKVPGCGDKKTLLQPGAQKLTMTFRLAPEYQIQEVNLERGHKEYRVICTLKSIQSGNFVGQGVGCCSSMESKYRFRGGARRCPKCGKEAIIMGKRFKPTDPEPGWLCWTKKDGCGATWPKGAQEIEGQSIEKVENENPADTFNTVLKMAKKRAFVDATITATAASDIFTQDIGDEEGESTPEAPEKPLGAPGRSKDTTRAPKAPASPTPAPNSASVAPAAPKMPTEATRKWMIEQLHAGSGEPARQLCTDYFQKAGILLPNEVIEDLPFRFVPSTPQQMRLLAGAVAAFEAGEEAKQAFPTHEIPEKPEAPIELPRDKPVPPKAPKVIDREDPEWWRGVIVPIPHKGEKRAEYMKNPETIGFLYDQRHDDTADGQEYRQRLWGFINHYEPKGWTKNDGTQMPPSETDILFREALDACNDYHEREHPDEKL